MNARMDTEIALHPDIPHKLRLSKVTMKDELEIRAHVSGFSAVCRKSPVWSYNMGTAVIRHTSTGRLRGQ